MFHIHRFGPWQVDYQYLDTSFGGDMPSTAMVRFCKSCGLPRTKHFYGTQVRSTAPQMRGEHSADPMLREYIDHLRQRLDQSVDENGTIDLRLALNSLNAAVVMTRAAEAQGFGTTIARHAQPGSPLEGVAQQLTARAEQYLTTLSTHGYSPADVAARAADAPTAMTKDL